MDEDVEPTIALFMRALRTDRNTATELAMEGLTSIEEVAYVPLDELLAIPGLDKEQLPVLRERARTYLERWAAGEEP